MRSMLYWFEALSLIGNVSIAANSIQEARRWAVRDLFEILGPPADSMMIPMADELEMQVRSSNNPV